MTDTELWISLKKGNRDALEALFCRYYDDLFRYAVKFYGNEVVAEDHIQDLFLRIWKRRNNLGVVKGVKTYLWTALRRSLMQEHNKQSRKSEIYARVGKAQKRMQFDVEEIIIQKEKSKEKRKALKRAMDKLTPRQREIIYLRYYDGMTYEEIESITSLSYQTLRNYVCESLKVLSNIVNSTKTGIFLVTLVSSTILFRLLYLVG